MSNQSEPSQYRPKLFISHNLADKDAANKVAKRLQKISNRLDIHLALDPNFEGPRVGKSINAALKKTLGETSLVLLIFSSPDKRDWSWCMWECGVATDPEDKTPTNVVILSLRDEAPKPYEDTLQVKASDPQSVQTFINQLCTANDFFPDLEEPLTDRETNDDFIKEQAGLLYEDLAEFTEAPEMEEDLRWGGFTILLESSIVEDLNSLDSPPTGDELKEFLRNFLVCNPTGWGLSHFGYTQLTQGMTLADLRARWERVRGSERLQNIAWTEVIADELWRIITSRPTNLTWEPFLSVKDGASDLWVYPIIYKFRHHSRGPYEYEFDLLVLQTRSPREEGLM